MSRAVLLRAGATAATVLSLLASAGYVAAHAKDVAGAPLRPPVAAPAAAPPPPALPSLRITPSVRETSLPAITSTHTS